MVTVSINMNDSARVTLSAEGARVWNQYHEKVNREMRAMGASKWVENELKKEGDVIDAVLWVLFNIFGESFHMGAVVPFQNNVIRMGE